MIKDNVYPDYEDHHIEILNELDPDDVIASENSKGDCLIISIVAGLLIVAAILFTL